MTQWSPDTCGCVIVYDDNLTHRISLNACPKHRGMKGQDHLDVVLAHNRQKNHALNALVEHGEKNGFDLSRLSVGYHPGAPADNDPLIIMGVPDEHRSSVADLLAASLTAPVKII
jgi:hypothetical protein